MNSLLKDYGESTMFFGSENLFGGKHQNSGLTSGFSTMTVSLHIIF
jgi:hypothetical protein